MSPVWTPAATKSRVGEETVVAPGLVTRSRPPRTRYSFTGERETLTVRRITYEWFAIAAVWLNGGYTRISWFAGFPTTA